MLDRLSFDVLELVVFRLKVLSAADVRAVKLACRGLNAALTSHGADRVRHFALDYAYCLRAGLAAPAYYAIKNLGADPGAFSGRALRVAIKEWNAPLFNWIRKDNEMILAQSSDALALALLYAAKYNAFWAIQSLLCWEPYFLKMEGEEKGLGLFALRSIIRFGGATDEFINRYLLVLIYNRHHLGAEAYGDSTYLVAQCFAQKRLRAAIFSSGKLASWFGELVRSSEHYNITPCFSEMCMAALIEFAGRGGPEEFPGYRAVSGAVWSRLTPAKKKVLGYALAGVARPDLAEGFLPDAVFEFCVEPTDFEGALAIIQGESEHTDLMISVAVAKWAPVEAVARLLSGVSGFDLMGGRIDGPAAVCFAAAVERPPEEARMILGAIPGADPEDVGALVQLAPRHTDLMKILQSKKNGKSAAVSQKQEQSKSVSQARINDFFNQPFVHGDPERAVKILEKTLRIATSIPEAPAVRPPRDIEISLGKRDLAKEIVLSLIGLYTPKLDLREIEKVQGSAALIYSRVVVSALFLDRYAKVDDPSVILSAAREVATRFPHSRLDAGYCRILERYAAYRLQKDPEDLSALTVAARLGHRGRVPRDPEVAYAIARQCGQVPRSASSFSQLKNKVGICGARLPVFENYVSGLILD